jgi:hypothetical protein
MSRAAGPLLIIAAVLLVLHGFWLYPKLTNQHVDLLSFWLPRWCFLGTNLSHGHLPTWLPNQFGGVPFLSDPQSGWLYLPVMALFSATSCTRALGLFIALQPILAGLGLYWFLRLEGVRRPAATVGGLTLALSMAGSAVSLSVPFSGTLAWTALGLAGAAGYLHARGLPRRLAWLAVTELCLSQIAAAHLTDGLVIGVLVIGLYVVARSIAQVRAGHRSPASALLVAVVPFALIPLLAAAVLIPRLALLPRTSIGHGYQALGRLANRLSGTGGSSPLAPNGVGPWWGTAFARGPGGYAGALAVLSLPLAFASRRWRLPALAFGAVGLIGWILNLDGLVSSQRVRSAALGSKMGELWLRDPYRFRYLLPLAVAVLAGYAVDGWLNMERSTDRRALVRRTAWLLPSLVVLVGLPLMAGAKSGSYLPLLIGGAVMIPALLAVARGGPSWILPVLTAVELAVVALVSQPEPAPPRLQPVFAEAGPGLGRAFAPLHAPTIEPAAYVTPGPIGRAIRTRDPLSRYLTYDPGVGISNPRGFLLFQGRADWAAYENGRSVLFGLNEIQGYSPVQLLPYWSLVRRVDLDAPIFYNTAYFQRVEPAVLRLFAVEWVIQRSRVAPAAGSTRVARESRYSLYRLNDPTPRASVVFTWRAVDPDAGLDTVLNPRFDSDRQAIVAPAHGGEPEAASGPRTPPAPALYRELQPNHARVRIRIDTPGLLVIRNPYDRNWTATVDGRAAPVLIADYAMQGVLVPAGSHVVDLRYRDPAVGFGLVVSAAGWAALLGALAWASRRARRSSRGEPVGEP